MEARIEVGGSEADMASLWDWLRHEPRLRGRLTATSAPAPEEAMGAPVELVVALTSAGGLAAVLARTLSSWLVERERQRRSDVTVKVTGPDGRVVQVSARRVPDSEQLLRSVLESSATDWAAPLPEAPRER
jgi:hypothetical protein